MKTIEINKIRWDARKWKSQDGGIIKAFSGLNTKSFSNWINTNNYLKSIDLNFNTNINPIKSLELPTITSSQSTPSLGYERFSRIEGQPTINRGNIVSSLTTSYQKAGVTNPEVIKALVAQDILESGWGEKTKGRYNYGNITKGNWTGSTASHTYNGRTYQFRSYPDVDSYTQDKWNLLQRQYGITNNDTYQSIKQKLNARGYAEEEYGSGLDKVYQQISRQS